MLLLLLSCHPDGGKPDTDGLAAPIDLVTPLRADEARAGVVTNADALWDGISAEGAPGDIKIYNDRVRFIVEAVGDGGYYGDDGGALLDVDLVRPEGEPGRDLLDEAVVMVGLGRTVRATSVEVVADGLVGGDAVVVVRGVGTPLRLITGALENPDLVADLALDIETTYRLAPGAWTLEVTTRVTNREDDAVVLDIGDVAFVAQEVADAWAPGAGFGALDDDAPPMLLSVGRHNEGTLGVVAATGNLTVGATARLLGEIAPVLAGFSAPESLAAGATRTWTRHVGVAPDAATLLAEKVAREATPAQTVSGIVRDDAGAPLPGARMHLVDANDAIVTFAVTDANGAWSASLPQGATTGIATGETDGWVFDVPPGAPDVGAYTDSTVRSLTAVTAGAPAPAFLEGHGASALGDPATRTLQRPGLVTVRIADGGPAVVRACRVGGEPYLDARVVAHDAPCAATALVRDGDVELALAPGDYVVTAWRGVRDELAEGTVRVEGGTRSDLNLAIARAWDVPGVVTGDPHTHAAPSGDGKVSMTGRLLSMAASGVDLHFGTDHDHVVDYNPLLRALGLEGRLRSVMADEVSPVLRGHFNAWPAPVRDGPNGGAPRWWHGYADTAEIFGWMRDMVGTDGIIQANHPVGGSGLFSLAGLDTTAGVVAKPTHWSDDFDAVEVLNSGDTDGYFETWLALLERGVLATPVGVSDAHGPLSGRLGHSLTFFLADVPPAAFDDAALKATMARGATVASRGPFIEARVDGAWAPGGLFTGATTLDVIVHAASWIPVDRVVLYANGTRADVRTCEGRAPEPCRTQFALAPQNDAVYVVVAESDREMGGPGAGTTAWATTSAVRVDTAGDGWTAPLPPLVLRSR